MNYETYKSLLDFVSSTQEVDDNLQDLIKEYIKTREQSSILIKPIYTDIEQINIGNSLVLFPKNNKYEAINLKLDFNGFTPKINNCSYETLKDNTIVLKSFISNYVDKLSENYLKKDNNSFHYLDVKYSSNVDETKFDNLNIPTIQWFKNNFFTKDEAATFTDLKSLSKDTDDNIALNLEIFSKLTATTSNSIILNNLEYLESNIIDLSLYNINIKDENLPIVLKNINTREMEDYNSVVTEESVSKYLILKTLSNISYLSIDVDPTNPLSVTTKENALNLDGVFNTNDLYVSPTVNNKRAVAPLKGQSLNKIIDSFIESNDFYEFYSKIKLEDSPDIPKEAVYLLKAGIFHLLTGKVPEEIESKMINDNSISLKDSKTKKNIYELLIESDYYKGLPSDLTLTNFLVAMFNDIEGNIFVSNNYNLNQDELMDKTSSSFGVIAFKNRNDYCNFNNSIKELI